MPVADLVLFHHAQGLTPGVHALADALRAGGHRVVLPDLYEGATFDDLEAGVDHARQVGFDVLRERGVAAAADLPAGTVYAGISLGVTAAMTLAQTRPGAGGAVLLCGSMPVDTYAPSWPEGVPLQLHVMEGDADWGDVDVAREIAATVPEAELFLYPGEEHLWLDSSLPVHDPEATALLVRRLLAFLDAR